jgi:hypothetical protein
MKQGKCLNVTIYRIYVHNLGTAEQKQKDKLRGVSPHIEIYRPSDRRCRRSSADFWG